MGKLIKCCFITKNLPDEKAIEESFEEPGFLVTRAKVGLKIPGLVTQLLIIEEQYECIVKLRNDGKCQVHHQKSGATNPRT